MGSYACLEASVEICEICVVDVTTMMDHHMRACVSLMCNINYLTMYYGLYGIPKDSKTATLYCCQANRYHDKLMATNLPHDIWPFAIAGPMQKI